MAYTIVHGNVNVRKLPFTIVVSMDLGTRLVECSPELTDEDGEMEAFWQDGVDLVNRE